jgi:hypothetical protein
MSDYWYCCMSFLPVHLLRFVLMFPGQCGDGPHYASNVSVCTNWRCEHSRCTCCVTRSENHSYTTLSSTGLQRTASLHDHSHGHGHIPAGTQSHENPVDGGSGIFRWVCCVCRGDNSCKFDVGCNNCNNHWRQGCCYVYEVELRK